MKQLKYFFQHGGRLLTVMLLVIITFCYAMFQGGFVSWFVFFTIFPFALYSILLAFVPLRFHEVSRTFSKERLERGDRVFVTVKFHNANWLPVVFLSVSELAMEETDFEAMNGNTTRLFIVGWKRQFEWTYELKDLQRGEHYFRGLQITCSDFFGWTIRQLEIEQPQLFYVYPKVHTLQTTPLRMQYDQGAAMRQYSLLKDTTMVTGVRDYVPGDRFSWIHWKSFAKNGELKTKEFEDKQSQNTFVIIDRSIQRNFEQVVDFTASYIQKMVKERAEISFLSAGIDRFFAPIIKTDSQFEKVMQHLVLVQSDARYGVERLLFQEQKIMSRSVIVIVTGELTKELISILETSSQFANKVQCFVVNGHAPNDQVLAGKSEVHYVSAEWLDRIISGVTR